MLGWATFSKEDGTILHGGRSRRQPDLLPKALLEGPVYATLDRADTPEQQALLRGGHAIFFLPYDRVGIDPFKDRFPITLRYEGTVRGTGGIRLAGDDCSTDVAGLYAAGDAATRERVCGAASGGGAFNAAWAITSGTWSGSAAARYSLGQQAKASTRPLRPAGQAGIRPRSDNGATINNKELVEAIQKEVQPLEINYFRSISGLTSSLERLNALWPEATGAPGATVQEAVRAREAAAMAATARWMYTAAIARKESRGMHQLSDHPDQDPEQTHRLILSGIDEIEVTPEPGNLYAESTRRASK
jgi:succinate dehydrogenase/fumarate reductase flavoprotein subunit